MEQSDTVHDEHPGQNPPAKRKMDLGIILIWLLAGVLIAIALSRGSSTVIVNILRP